MHDALFRYYDIKSWQWSRGCEYIFWLTLKMKMLTVFTSRQGLGVGGGTPYGFDVGQSERGNVLKGLDLETERLHKPKGCQRLVIIPPELAYGKKGVQEIPLNATIELDIELLSIKQSPFGTPVKIVEG
ncbi:peptidyl-prolyl cis-trans isomerase FKBP16-4, chloroplastic isoform X1 [Arabidopsis lyrata subsp. lyrata]|uniref:peptidyl-prolyl cis-trans isomerase FKBP16-4, chloroplastic isoform X1 n=1 Tax=Arabidopsis lyrata subsp. lyrata TaxID=81972 RepID=UPI000A29B5B2|nr:peptidyl-prolyl cis-trans isomerase FKBP16-4, chloroplastic isoform X1 [Arabidopsis lyrata subsp. lyrata]|eukprot:XP_020885661.1 peptidyl-prolyl cis-trans isomerase FKBP16-4, chloroplastic isoform X1 [Arabidopsis lyrata subsp. lyrata]